MARDSHAVASREALQRVTGTSVACLRALSSRLYQWQHEGADVRRPKWTNEVIEIMRIRLVGYVGCVSLFVARMLIAQTPPPPDFDVSVEPPDGSILIEETTNRVYTTINNLSLFTNVTVSGSFGAQSNIPFRDNGATPDVTADDGTFSGTIITPKVTNSWTNMTLRLTITGEVLQPP